RPALRQWPTSIASMLAGQLGRSSARVGCKEPPPSQLGQRTEVISLPGSPGRAPSATPATDLSDWLFVLALACCSPSTLRSATADPPLCSFIPAPALRLPLRRWPASSRLPPAPTGVPSASAP